MVLDIVEKIEEKEVNKMIKKELNNIIQHKMKW